MKYQATYKCPLCGKLQYSNPTDIPYDSLPSILGQIVKNQQMISNPFLYQAPMYIPCKCRDGNAGLAQFVGFTAVKEKSKHGYLHRLLRSNEKV